MALDLGQSVVHTQHCPKGTPMLKCLALLLLLATPIAQTKQQLRTMPSSAEILELANKADEKVKVFEKALKASAPYLDKDTVQTDQSAADGAHTLINTIRKNGPSMYGLVGLLSTLDDLTLDASRASRPRAWRVRHPRKGSPLGGWEIPVVRRWPAAWHRPSSRD